LCSSDDAGLLRKEKAEKVGGATWRRPGPTRKTTSELVASSRRMCAVQRGWGGQQDRISRTDIMREKNKKKQKKKKTSNPFFSEAKLITAEIRNKRSRGTVSEGGW